MKVRLKARHSIGTCTWLVEGVTYEAKIVEESVAVATPLLDVSDNEGHVCRVSSRAFDIVEP